MKLVILDRDGVINYDSPHYIKSLDEWYPIPGSLAAIALLCHAGYKIAVATNQSGIGRGYYTAAMLAAIHNKLLQQLADCGGTIDKIVYCPHLPSENCRCRKPQIGLLEQIAAYFGCSLQGVPFIGDRPSDVEAALRVGAIPIVVGAWCQQQVTHHFKDLSAAVTWLLHGYSL